ncbi:response regulator [uncultured Algimonas sp.]|uniref:response regulator n=1 Tax=uncultured Algimonas sp. TaxID=1547920 RepID=UPI0026086861|nr:response regulator [uncultured Algimonas sp.]
MAHCCLIVDRSAMVRRVAARIVRELDFEITEAQTGREALDSCAAQVPHVVLLDWKSADMEAQGFIESLRDLASRQGVSMPTVLFCTAERSVDRIVAALKAGADEYIMKPFDSDIITAKFALAGLLSRDRTCAAA